MIRGTARSGDVDIAYSVEGGGPETLLLIMGLGGRAADWGREFPAVLAERFRVVRVDNRGAGASPRVPGGFSLEDLAGDAVAVLDAVGAARAHVMGISMGGMISQLIALDHADRVDRLVLMSTNFGGTDLEPPHPDALQLFDPGEFLARGADPVGMMRRTLEVITGPGFVDRNPELLAEFLEHVRAQPTPPGTFMGQLQAILGSDRSARVAEIRHPTLVIHGDADKLIPPANGRSLAERIPGARLEMLRDVGHMPMLEEPRNVARLVGDFLAAR
ncbi:MAG: alpha/beta fold hydrolase [Deltaproteobacteria bacterium]|nr:alpha/beta fold hydrolase [Deltaproteobacteria bacterium]